MKLTTDEVQAAAKHYAPAAENLQRAFVFGYENGRRSNGMSVHESLAAGAGIELRAKKAIT